MPTLFNLQSKQTYWPHTALFALLIIFIGLLYYPGIEGTFYFDDIRPFSPLTNVSDIESALLYIFNDNSGPLGRPVSMLSFLVHVNDWSSESAAVNSRAFFQFNVVLHLTNGILVFLLTFYLAKLYHGVKKTNYWLAIATSALWLTLPMHVSTSLIAVQRMAGLSAFFVFTGLLLYIYGLNKQSLAHAVNRDNNQGLILQLLGLVAFTLLALLSKENGVLLPVFALILEITLLAKVSTIQYRRKLRISACTAGLIALLVYLSYLVITGSNESPGRENSVIERILTQPKILFEYLYLSFIPDITAFNPFHDNYPFVSSVLASYKTLLSISALCLAFITGIYYRRKHPLYSFAVLWFLGAHLLESTVINLELYFEHRNYVALFGPCLALVFSVNNVSQRYKRITIIAFSFYWLLLCTCLFLTTNIWGQPLIAAQMWQAKQPNSTRAAEHLSNRYLKSGQLKLAQEVMAEHIRFCKDCTNSHAMALYLSCYANKEDATRTTYHSLLSLAKTTTQATGVGLNLRQLQSKVISKQCKYISINELKVLNNALLNSPISGFNKKLPYLQNLYMLALNERNREEGIRLLYLAWREQPEDLIANELVLMLLASKRTSEAELFITDQVCQRASINPIIANSQQKQCLALSEKVKTAIKVEKARKNDPMLIDANNEN